MRIIPAFVAALVGFLPAWAFADELSVGNFLDSYKAAAEARVSATARISCKYYTARGQVIPKEINGVITFGGYTSPFSVMTLQTEELRQENKEKNTVLLSSQGGRVRMVDARHAVTYDEDVARAGGRLIASQMDGLFLYLMYPEVFERWRGLDGVVVEEKTPGGGSQIIVVVQDDAHSRMIVDKNSYLPLRLECNGDDPNGGDWHVVITFSEFRVLSFPPPDELFDVNLIFGYGRERYDPDGLYALAKAPDFDVALLDGRKFVLSEEFGKPVFLCFRGVAGRNGADRDLCFDRAGDKIRARGGVFLDIYPTPSSLSSAPAASVPIGFSCRNDVVGRQYKVNPAWMPRVVAISPEGRVTDVIEGYIPGFTERSLDSLADAYLPAGVPATGK